MRAQIPEPVAGAMDNKRGGKKVKTLLTGLLDAGLRFVQRELYALHHPTCPTQCLFRATAAKDHKVIGIVDDSSVKSLTPFGDPPVLQKAIHIDVGKQWADHPTGPEAQTLWCPYPLTRSAVLFASGQWSPTGVLLASCPMPPSLLIPLLCRNLQPHLDQMQHVPIDDSPSHTLQQLGVRNVVKAFGQIRVDYLGVALAE